MTKRIVLFYDAKHLENADKLKNIISALTGAAEVQVETYSYDKANTSFYDAAIIFLLLPEIKTEDDTVISVLDNLCCRIVEQHIPVIPVSQGENDLRYYPDSVRKLHMLSFTDNDLNKKILFVIKEQTEVLCDIEETARNISSGQLALKECTAKQLFLYAAALLQGVGVQQNIKEALTLLRVLVGNDAFDAGAIDISVIDDGKPYTGELLGLCMELDEYLSTRAAQVFHTEDYRDAELFMDYCILMQKISSFYLFNFSTDNALRLTKNVLLNCFGNDSSLKAGKWLLNYLWEEASRAARNRYFDKAVESLLQIIAASETLLKNYDDQDILSPLCAAIYVLQFCRDRLQDRFDLALVREVTDDIEDDGTFHPPYRTAARDAAMLSKMRSLSDRLLTGESGILMIRELYLLKRSQKESAVQMLIELARASKLLYMLKFTTQNNAFAVWYHNQINLVLSAESELGGEELRSLHLVALYGCSETLQLLKNRHYLTSDENLLSMAQLQLSLFDRDAEYFTSLGLDRSESYDLISLILEKQGRNLEADEAYLELCRIVAKRDKNDEEVIKRLLEEIYIKIQARKSAGPRGLYESYVRLAWDICRTNPIVPVYYCEPFIEHVKTLDESQKHRILSEEEMIRYRREIPQDQEMIGIVYSMAYRELYEILKLLNEECNSKVPDDLSLKMRSEMNLYYSFVYDRNKPAGNQNVLMVTRNILKSIFESNDGKVESE